MSRLKWIAIILVIALAFPMTLSFFRSDEEIDKGGISYLPVEKNEYLVSALSPGVEYSTSFDLGKIYAFSGEEDGYIGLPFVYLCDGSKLLAVSYDLQLSESPEELSGFVCPDLFYDEQFDPFTQDFNGRLVCTFILEINQDGNLEYHYVDHDFNGFSWSSNCIQLTEYCFGELIFCNDRGDFLYNLIESGVLYVTVYERPAFSLDDVKEIEKSRFVINET